MVEIIKAVQRAGGNDASAEDVLRELNVGKTDRLWAYGIPAAILFGLVERNGRGDHARLSLTPLGMRLALPGLQDEERATKAAVFRTPELYAKLLEKFANHPVPSKESLKNILQRDFKIVESMAGFAADAFLESLKTAELVTPAGTVIGGDAAGAADEKPDAKKTDSEMKDPPPPPGMQNVAVPNDFIVYTCKIGKGRIIKVPLPPDFTQVDVDRLHAFLKTQVDDDVTVGKP
ncbi:MAG TPA: hypothetical protein VGL61_25950 [Kofleriaceae bacterium]